MPRVLIAREPEKASLLIARLAELGIEGIAFPVTVIQLIEQSSGIPNPDEFRAMLFTSAKAVEITADIFIQSKLRLDDSILLFTVGTSTAEAVKTAFGKPPDLVGKGGGEELASLITEYYPVSTPILWPAAEDTASDMAALLGKFSITVRKWQIYRTSQIDFQALKDGLGSLGEFDAVFFASPSAVSSLGRIAYYKTKPGIAIGVTTAEAMAVFGWDKIEVAISPGIESCTEAILGSLQN